jgi:hypothetical protein
MDITIPAGTDGYGYECLRVRMIMNKIFVPEQDSSLAVGIVSSNNLITTHISASSHRIKF